jgi:arylsulfatase
MKPLIFMLLISLILPGCSGEPEIQPNIVLVSVDTLRWDYLSTYGFPESDISPAAERLADNGTVFQRATASAGTTIPSHGTMLTGLYPRMHGARSNYHGLYSDTTTLAEAMIEDGYQTGAFVSNSILVKVGDLGRGFQANNLPFRDEIRKGAPQSGEKTTRQVSEWLDSLDPESPFFLFMHLWEPHGPYLLTERAREKLGAYDGMLKDGVTLEHIRKRIAEIVGSEDNLKAMRTIYAGEVNLADQYLDRFLDDLAARGLLSNTVVIFTADHGQSLGENQRMGHGPTHRENVIRVPLIVADFRNPVPARVDTRVGTIDISPTIAEFAGMDTRFDWLGRSLVRPDELKDGHPYYAEVELRTEMDKQRENWKMNIYDPESVAVWMDDFKLTWKNGIYAFYETEKARNGQREITEGDELAIGEYLTGLLESFRATEIDFTAGEVTEEDLKLLQGLGYVQ